MDARTSAEPHELATRLLRIANLLVRLPTEAMIDSASKLDALDAMAREVLTSLPPSSPSVPPSGYDSARDLRTARILAAGGTYKDVAAALGIALSTAQARVRSLYLKLGVHSKKELRWLVDAMDHGADPAAKGS